MNRLASVSLRTVAAILVRIQAERKGGDLVLVCVNNFTPCTFLPGCARRTGLPVALYPPSRRFWTAYKRNWKVWIWFQCVSIIKLSMYEFPGLRGGNRRAGGSLRTVAAIFVRIQERKGGDLVLVCVNIFIPCTSLSVCAGRTGFPAALYLRSRRFWNAYKWNGRVGIWL